MGVKRNENDVLWVAGAYLPTQVQLLVGRQRRRARAQTEALVDSIMANGEMAPSEVNPLFLSSRGKHELGRQCRKSVLSSP